MSSDDRVVMVAGAQGAFGRASAEHFAQQEGVKVYGLAQSELDIPGVESIIVVQLDFEGVAENLAELTDVTHLVFGAYVEKPTAAERCAVNGPLLSNLLDVLEANAPGLRHVTLYQAARVYGAELGPFKTPAREDDPRLMPPNFYYDQEDILRNRSQGKAWSWTALRPEGVCGFALGHPMNLAMVIAVYATLSRRLGLPLRFPGPREAYESLYQVTSSDLLARAVDWVGVTPSARGEIFNVNNGDYFRWEHLWPRLAAMFDMDVAPPMPMRLTEYMADKAPLWDAIVREFGLQPIAYKQLNSWGFADFLFHCRFDNIYSTVKIRRHGFHDCMDTEDMFRDFFDGLRDRRVIPPLA